MKKDFPNMKKSLVAASLLGCVALTSMSAAQAQTTVDYNGVNYTLAWQATTYNASTALLMSQPWWGNSGKALAFANFNIDPNSNFVNRSAYFAYANAAGHASGATFYGPGAVPPNTLQTDSPADAGLYWYAYVLGMAPDQSLLNSLQSSSMAVNELLNDTSLLVNGSHGHPLAHLVASGEKTVWVDGDFGQNDHGSYGGSVGLAEIGGGYNFGAFQLNLSVGSSRNQKDLIYSGSAHNDEQFVTVEAVVPLAEAAGVYGTFGLYSLWGSTNIHRGYIDSNGTAETSSGNPDSSAWAARARLDWDKAESFGSTQMSPYVDLSYYATHLAGYTETGGSLPVLFDGRDTHTTELHLGFNTATPLSSSGLSFLTNLEVAQRSNSSGAGASGQVIGLLSFNVAGQSYEDKWLKGGIGLEGKLGDGKLSVMLNGTTNSGMPNAWLAASYRIAF